MNKYLLLVSVHLEEECKARKMKEGLGWFLICIYQNTAEEHAQIPLYCNELWKTAEAVGERESKPARAEKLQELKLFPVSSQYQQENYFQNHVSSE